MGEWADRLIERLERGRHWPPPDVARAWKQVTDWQAFRENDHDALKVIANWQTVPRIPAPKGVRRDDREYLVDPLPEKIPESFADMNFAVAPAIEPGVEADKERLDGLVAANRLGSALKREGATSSSEGEVWWRIRADLEVSERAIIDWYSRAAVIPLFSSRRLVACAFVSRLFDLRGDAERHAWRHLEVHDATDVTNVLYDGVDDELGQSVALDRHPETESLREEWNHDLGDMLAGRIVNREGADPTLGKSDYDGIKDLLLALNEILTIGQENARLTLKRRVVVPAAALDEAGRIPDGQEAIVAESVDDDLGGSQPGGSPFRVLEYTFDADALIKYGDSVAIKALSRVGITPQFIGVPTTDGYAPTGTALRLRLVPQVNAANGRGNYYDEEMPHVLRQAARVDAMTQDAGGCGVPWSDPEHLPSFERSPAIPADPVEEADRHGVLVTNRIESRRQAIGNLHPDWDDAQIDDELKAIEDDPLNASSTAAGGASSLFNEITGRTNPGADPGVVDG